MECKSPITAWKSESQNQLVFSKEPRDALATYELPCGKCTFCRLQKASDWQARIWAESQIYKYNYHCLLTYAPEHMPEGGSLSLDDIKKFIERLRHNLKAHQPVLGKKGTNPKTDIRYAYAAEYGEQLQRPHYHFILMNTALLDLTPFKQFNTRQLYKSDTLEKLWGKGFVNIMPIDSAEIMGYVARYTMKKVGGNLKDQHYKRIDEHGEVIQLKPEFLGHSNDPPIGVPYLEKYGYVETLHQGVMIEKSHKRIPRQCPPALVRWIEKKHPDEVNEWKFKTYKKAVEPLKTEKGRYEAYDQKRVKQRQKAKLLVMNKTLNFKRSQPDV